jgi:hypothetical protein
MDLVSRCSVSESLLYIDCLIFPGCDSGFGFQLAKHLTQLGFKVFAGCLNKTQGGQGARDLVNNQ